MQLRTGAATALLALSTSACRATPDQVWRGTFGLTATVVDEFEADLDGGGFFATGDTEYGSIELGFGGLRFATDEAGEPTRAIDAIDFRLGFAEFGDLDALELASGGRLFLGESSDVRPFLSLHGVTTVLEEVDGFLPGAQFGARFGAGVLFFVGDAAFLDLTLDHTISVLPAESDFDPVLGDEVETELSGTALRVGFGLVL